MKVLTKSRVACSIPIAIEQIKNGQSLKDRKKIGLDLDGYPLAHPSFILELVKVISKRDWENGLDCSIDLQPMGTVNMHKFMVGLPISTYFKDSFINMPRVLSSRF